MTTFVAPPRGASGEEGAVPALTYNRSSCRPSVITQRDHSWHQPKSRSPDCSECAPPVEF